MQTKPTESALPPMLTLAEVCAALRAARPTVYRWTHHEGFPRPIKFGRASRWNAHEVAAWIAERQAAR